MPDKHLYEFAIIRVVPRVEREEFINVGVILCSIKMNFLKCDLQMDRKKLIALDPSAEIELIQIHLDAFAKICEGKKEGGPIACRNISERFRWLTAVRSSIIQTSRPHPGITDNLEETFEQLFEAYVG
ncbi:MAG: DUF3037 domain-containing protein [Cyclobacteriaceae bacterium]